MLLEQLGAPISAVPLLEVPDDILIARIVERGKSSGRNDDNEEVARHRQDIYRQQTPAPDRLLRRTRPPEAHQWSRQYGRGLPPLAAGDVLSVLAGLSAPAASVTPRLLPDARRRASFTFGLFQAGRVRGEKKSTRRA